MKKNLLKSMTVCAAVCALALGGCGGMKNGWDGGYYPSVVPEYTEIVSDENYVYESVEERGFVQTEQTPSSYFSLDRNTAGYSFMRNQVQRNIKIDADSVRLEEYVNYFSYDYPAPAKGEGVAATAYLSSCPWNAEHKLITVGVQTEEAYLQSEGGNYVFLVDVSGSMSGGGIYAEGEEYMSRLDLVKYSLKILVDNLTEADSVAIVTYASGVSTKLSATKVTENNRSKIVKAIDGLTANGSTNGAGGLERAYEQAKTNFRTGGNNRVILLSDGDFNVGMSDTTEMKEFIQEKAKSGVYLSVLGVGMGNTRDDLMQTLALNGNGNYAYIDTKLEAEKVFKEELNGTLYTVAKDMKAGVTFEADYVQFYRLLGYDMKRMSQSDFENSEKDAGEIGSNLCVTAMYEIELKEGVENAPLAEVHLKWKDVDENAREKKITVNNAENGTTDTEFAACVAEFALVLRNSKYAGEADLASVLQRLNGMDSYLQADTYKSEFKRLVQRAIESEYYVLSQSENTASEKV